MATLVLLDLPSCGAHCDVLSHCFSCKPDLNSQLSRPPLSRPLSLIGGKVRLESSFFARQDGKVQSIPNQAAAADASTPSRTTRCVLAQSVDVLDPLHRLIPSSDEAIRPRPVRTSNPGNSQSAWNKARTSAVADRDGGVVSSPLFSSSSQSSHCSRRRTLSNGAAIQVAAAIPSRSAKDLKGGVGGMFMGVTALMVGLVAVLQKSSLVSHKHTTICSTCRGYGKIPCFICGGRGNVQWEGKLNRADPCPLCFGSCTAKCSSCGGIRVYKGVPPFQQQLSQRFTN